MTTWAHNTAHYCGIWSGDPVWLRLRLRFSSFCSEQALLSIIFFFLPPSPSPQELAISLTAFVPYGKIIVEPRGRNASLERMDFILRYFRWLFIYVVSYCCSRQRSVEKAEASACVCVRVCAPGARLLPPLFQFAAVNIQLSPRSERSRESLLLYLFFSIEIPHGCWWPAASAPAPRLPCYRYLWSARDGKASCIVFLPGSFFFF